MWRAVAWAAVFGKDKTPPHRCTKMRFTGSSEPQLPEERLTVHGGDEGGRSGSLPKSEVPKDEESPHSYTYTYESEEDGEDQGDEGDKDDGDEEEPTPLQSETLEEYYTKRVFTFIHHFAGPEDPLTAEMRNEALAQGIRLVANYQFLEGDNTMVTCAKCLGPAHGKEVEGAD